MSDLEREAVGDDIIDHLDSIDEIMDNSDIDSDDDEQFLEIAHLVQRIREIIAKEE